jgi:23S rRNA (guanine745-N1)-methyltransferase
MTATGFTSPAQRREALSRAADRLRCPVCAGRLSLGERALTCPRRHSFDIARQGYVNLTAGRAGPGTGDSAAMVTAREEFLGAGHYRPIAESAQSLAARFVPAQGDGGLVPAHGDGGLVVDLAGGTGYYLAQVLDALPGSAGLCVDLSAPALRRAARAHPRAAAIGADAWQPLPLAERSAVLILSIFGPRNAAEISRILAPGGTLIIAAPGPAHLAELRGPIGIIGVDDDKDRRIANAFGDYAQAGEADARFRLRLDHTGLAALVGMGPSARHIAPETLTARIQAMPSQVMVTADVRVRALRRPRLHSRPPSRALAPPRSHGNRRLATAGHAESGPDGDRALRHQLDHRPEGFPPVGHRGITAPPRAAVAARLVKGAGQRADRAEQLRPCRLVQPRQHRVDLREQPGDHPEAARQFRSGLRAADLTKPAHRPVRGVGEVHRDADQGIVWVHAAGAEVQGLPHAPAAGVQPLRPRQPVVAFLIITEKAVLVVELLIGVAELVIKVRLIEHDALELAGVQPECLLEPGNIALAQQVKQRLLVCLRTCLRTGLRAPSGHRNPPHMWIELTFQQYGGGMTKRG